MGRSEYRRLAKGSHPDLVPDKGKREAEKKFVKLNQDFHEANSLLEECMSAAVSPNVGHLATQHERYHEESCSSDRSATSRSERVRPPSEAGPFIILGFIIAGGISDWIG